MMKTALPRLALIVAAVMLLTSAYHRVQSSDVVSQAANAFLASLTPDQKAKATFQFQDEERFNFHFIPRERKGIAIRELNPMQRHLANALLAAGLSQRGFIKATQIMSLEEVLRIMENDSGERRNPDKYYFSIFGQPGPDNTWGYRVEGHHLSQNFTVARGRVADAPSFFGANPAEVRQGPRQGLRVLAAEEDLGRDLLMSLDDSQRKVAVVSETAYKDILTAANRKASIDGQPSGLPASKMNAKQFEKLTALIAEYADNMPEQMAQARMEQAKKAGKNLHFAWAGVADRGGPHYYRIQSPTFLIEYDNTQNNANHIHSVWRDFTGDFGADLLQEHYRTSHR
jgi:hypothetical protein